MLRSLQWYPKKLLHNNHQIDQCIQIIVAQANKKTKLKKRKVKNWSQFQIKIQKALKITKRNKVLRNNHNKFLNSK